MSFSICSACTLVQFKPQTQISISRVLRPSKRNFKPINPIPVLLFGRDVHTDQRTPWIEPQGHETGISLYSSMTKLKVPFKTLNPGLVMWYNCGPTVYDSAHIGHALSYVKLDIMRRIMQDIFKLNVVKVTGITDIDDKIIARAKQLNTSVSALTQKYEKEFFEDMDKLNVMKYSVTPRVTDHIPQIVSFVGKIMENGLAYSVGEGTVYFDTESYGRYGKLVGQIKESSVQIDTRKKSSRDFALWKGTKKSESLSWDSPWGPGRPGWHIECSTMASWIFGERLDLHSGGMDLKFPHHENEEAQCCAHHACEQWCNYWIHTGHLHVNDSIKMSKSLNNTVSIKGFLQDHSSNAFRLFCLYSNYRTLVDYTSESMETASSHLKKIISFFQNSEEYVDGSSFSGPLDDPLILQKFFEAQNTIRSSLADDFNTKSAMNALFILISTCNRELEKNRKAVRVGRSIGTISAVRQYIQNLLTTLGLKFQYRLPVESEMGGESKCFAQVMDSTLTMRKTVKDFALLGDKKKEGISKEEASKLRQERSPLLSACDKLREEFADAGIQLTDYREKSTWRFQQKKSDVDDPSSKVAEPKKEKEASNKAKQEVE